MNRDEAKKRYGEIANGKWADEAKWMAIYKPEQQVADKMINSATGKATGKIYCNKDMLGPLNQAFSKIVERGLLPELETFDGCFLIRDVRGVPGAMSWHSYGLAIDINAKGNGLGAEPKLSQELVNCFKEAGFTWGGDFKRKDGMHFQLGSG
jgi:hypothetical protein